MLTIVFRLLIEGAPLLAINKGRYYKRTDDLALGAGNCNILSLRNDYLPCLFYFGQSDRKHQNMHLVRLILFQLCTGQNSRDFKIGHIHGVLNSQTDNLYIYIYNELMLTVRMCYTI